MSEISIQKANIEIDFNSSDYKKFVDVDLDVTLQLVFKKLVLS